MSLATTLIPLFKGGSCNPHEDERDAAVGEYYKVLYHDETGGEYKVFRKCANGDAQYIETLKD
jgi:hypothetical protein